MKRIISWMLTASLLLGFIPSGLAEEIFSEESFADAGFVGEEFFAEEGFPGDAFVAEESESIAETEERSAFFFAPEQTVYEDESQKPEWAKLTPRFRNVYDGKLYAVEVKGKKISLEWDLWNDEGPARPKMNSKKDGTAGVSFFLYQVDTATGLAKQIKKLAGYKATVSVKQPGTYTYYVRAEYSVKGEEKYGFASEPVKAVVTSSDEWKTITKLKAAAAVTVKADEEGTLQPVYDAVLTISAKEAPDAYKIEANEKMVNYSLTAAERGQLNGGQAITLTVSGINEYAENDEDKIVLKPEKTEFTVTPVRGEGEDEVIGKAKKAKLTLKAPVTDLAKIQPVIISAEQTGDLTVLLRWSYPIDLDSEKFTIQIGKSALAPVSWKEGETEHNGIERLSGENGVYEYAAAVKVAKAGNVKLTVTPEGGKASKAVKVKVLKPEKANIINAKAKYKDRKALVTWNSLNSALTGFEVYATGSGDKPEIVKTENGYEAELNVTEGEPMISVEIKAMTGDRIMERKTLTLKNWIVGGKVFFGHYEQDNDETNGKESIEWRILARDGDYALLLAEYGLDAQPYNTVNTDVTWETCTLRAWLNGTFMNAAFTSAEQGAIKTTLVNNSQSQGWAALPGFTDTYEVTTTGGNNTNDKVFLLSLAEAYRYLGGRYGDGVWGTFWYVDNGMTTPTAYAKAQGAGTNSNGNRWWWLRSPGDNFQNIAAYVGGGSGLGDYYYVDYAIGAVRPALWVNLNSGIF